MKSNNEMSLFTVTINKEYKHSLLTQLSNINNIHIKSRGVEHVRKKIKEDPNLDKINTLRLNFTNLSKKLKINESDFSELKISKSQRIEFIVKDLNELINHTLEEVNFFLNRVIELESFITKAKIELENINIIEKSYVFLEQFHFKRDSLENINLLDFKIYTTFKKNLENLITLFDYSEIPIVYQTYPITEDRILFYMIYPKEKNKDFEDKINLIHAEEVPILKKYLLPDGINFTRIRKEIDLIQNTFIKYEKELKRLRNDYLIKFAAINEIIQNIEEYNWAEQQFEITSLDYALINFYGPINDKQSIIQRLTKRFKDKIFIKVIDIKRNQPVFDIEEKKEEIIKPDENLEKKAESKDLREDSPTIMHNFAVFRPYESLTRMYGVPAYSEIDPTPFLFFTFPLIFGLMFGDIGHGICLVISGLIGALVFRKRGGNLYNFCWIIFYCGWGAILGGYLYGEFFGAHEMLGIHLKPVTIPLLNITLQNPMNDIMSIFKFVILIGVFHIILGWFIQFLNYWKLKRRYMAFADSFLKILLLIGGTILIFTWGFNVNSWFIAPFPILLTLVPGILLIFSKPLGRFFGISYLKEETYGSLVGEGSIETFETVLSILSNVASYIRILALALAHISLMIAIKSMIELIPAGILFSQVLIIIGLIFGNLIVIVLEGMLVFINTLRLHFYEFFFKFYQGSGIEFFPFYLDDDYSIINFQVIEEKDIISEEIEREMDKKKAQEDLDEARSVITEKFL